MHRIIKILFKDEQVILRIFFIFRKPNIQTLFNELTHLFEIIPIEGSPKILKFIDINQHIQLIYCIFLKLLLSR